MPRSAPADRVPTLLAAAASVFVRHGFHRAQMDDVAAAAEVSKGTIYRSVSSKEALFVGVLDHADRPRRAPVVEFLDDADLEGATRRLLARLRRAATGTSIAQSPQPVAPGAIGAVTRQRALETFDVMSGHRIGIMVLDRCAPEIPAVAAVWFRRGRYSLVDGWEAWLRANAGRVALAGDEAVVARSIIELVAVWAVKIHWDPAPRATATDRRGACAQLVCNLVLGGAST